MNTTQKTLIIAYGNRDRQDDGAGWHILADCAASFNLTAPEFPGIGWKFRTLRSACGISISSCRSSPKT